MAKQAKRAKPRRQTKTQKQKRNLGFGRVLRRWVLRFVLLMVGVIGLATGTYAILNPPTGIYMKSEEIRLGSIDHEWIDMAGIAPVMARSVVAAEDANFCAHWGFDIAAIRTAIDSGGNRGASTITQQVVKNVYLWHGRNWTRKALEALLTPIVETVWSKQRILEIYLNMAEFDEGVFGVDAAAYHYFGIGPDKLSARQAALLAAVLPSPKQRSASSPSDFVRRRAASIMDGAATIRADGRAACFED